MEDTPSVKGRTPARDEILASEAQPIAIKLDSGLDMRLRPLSAADADRIAELDKTDIRPREKVVRLLHQQLESPALTEAELAEKDDADLITVFREWAARPDTFDVALDAHATIDDANRAIVSFVLDWTKSLPFLVDTPVIALATAVKRMNLKRSADPLGLGGLARQMKEFEGSMNPAVLKGIVEGRRAVDFAKKLNVPLSFARLFKTQHAATVAPWPGANLAVHLDVLRMAVGAQDKFINARALSMTRTTLLAESALAGLDLSRITSRLTIAPIEARAFTTAVSDHFRAFGRLVEALAKSVPKSDARLTYDIPAIEVFNEAELARALAGTPVEEDAVEERVERRNQIADELDAELPGLLRQLNPVLVRLLEGARQSRHGANIDRARHVLVSLRTLIDELLDILAPVKDVKAWCGPDDLLDNGQVKREARFRYLGRNLKFGRLKRAFEADMKALNELYGIWGIPFAQPTTTCCGRPQ